MSYRKLLVLLAGAWFFLAGAVGGETTMTFLTDTDSSLLCESRNPISNEIFQWIDQMTSPVIVIYNVENGVATKTTDQRYTNFNTDVSSYPSSVPLIIEDVSPENEGTYQCSQVRGQEIVTYNVAVEAVPISVKVSCTRNQANCPQRVGTSDEFICSCEAVGAYPDTLLLTWSNVEGSPATNPPTNSTQRPGAYDYTSTATFIPTQTKKIAACTVGGYNGSWTVEGDDYRTAPPVCQVETFCSGSNTGVTLTCNCHGAFPSDGLIYSFFQDDVMIHSGDTNSLEVSVQPDIDYEFGCRQCNGVNYDQESYSSVDVICTDNDTGTTTDSTITTEIITKTDQCVCNYSGFIAACSIEAMLIMVSVLVNVFFLSREWKGKKRQIPSRSKKEVSSSDIAENKAYMDLQGFRNEKNQDMDILQIPEHNVKMVSMLPGQGILQYHKALITRVNGSHDGVVRTLSDESTLSVIKILRSEVQDNIKLGNGTNIVKVLGWCDTVPMYVIFEHVNGRTLSHHIKEEFSPHTIHTYGNTNKRKFQVREKGNFGTLPKYALDVAKGLQFLTKNKFLHPGIRAKKILIDSGGNCKLYDFVSVKNANEWIRLIWNKSVPYQWMPPEFLFLENVSSAGDIWSFGVLLWEIFSYGSEPYIGQTRSDVEKQIRQKEFLPLPENCPGAIWQLMIACWEPTMERRPKIDEITFKLASMFNADKEYQEIQ